MSALTSPEHSPRSCHRSRKRGAGSRDSPAAASPRPPPSPRPPMPTAGGQRGSGTALVVFGYLGHLFLLLFLLLLLPCNLCGAERSPAASESSAGRIRQRCRLRPRVLPARPGVPRPWGLWGGQPLAHPARPGRGCCALALPGFAGHGALPGSNSHEGSPQRSAFGPLFWGSGLSQNPHGSRAFLAPSGTPPMAAPQFPWSLRG